MRFEGDRAVVNGRAYDVAVRPDDAAPPAPAQAPPTPATAPVAVVAVVAPMPGLVLRVPVRVGDVVAKGDEVMVLEAMKMENRISASVAGTIRALHVRQGDQVRAGQALVEIGA